MHDKFDIGFRQKYRDIYYINNSLFFTILSFLNFIIINEDIIKNHKYKENIEKIVNKELDKICGIPKLYKFYSEKISIIFDDAEYYIL
jgi:hypothetical protein